MSRVVIDQLRRALPTFTELDWLVVSDEYPPRVVGGSEISLHELIKGLGKEAANGLIIKIMAEQSYVSFYRYSGVLVLRLPRQATWRAPGMTVAEYEKALKIFRPRFLLDAWQVILLLLSYGMRRWRFDLIRFWVKGMPKGGLLSDALPEQFALTAELLKEIVVVLKPRVLIANNTRSIVSVYHSKNEYKLAWSDIKTIAMVRDNRFFCARQNQIMRVGGRDCIKCSFQCANEDAKQNPIAQTRLLKQTKDFRSQALRSMDSVVVTSQFLRAQIAKILDNGKQPYVVPNFAGDPDSVFQLIDDVAQPPGKSVAVIGSINEAKGQYEFLQNSMQELQLDPEIKIHFFGRGPRLEKVLRRFAKENNLEQQIEFYGHLDRGQLYAAIRECKVVALPTLWPEPFGRVPLEAALCGRPVVAFSSGGLRELIRDGETGFLVNKEDYSSFWRRIHELMHDGELRNRLAIAAKSDFLNRYSKSFCVKRFSDLLAS